MPCKHLISTGLLICVSTFLACTPSSSKKGQETPAAPNPPVNPEPTPKPNPAPIPVPMPPGAPTPNAEGAPQERMLGDWQSSFSDPNYFGNVTYSIQADGRVLTSLLIYSRGTSQIMAERHEFKGTFLKDKKSIQLDHVKGSCALSSAQVALYFTQSEFDSDILYLKEGQAGDYLRLSKLKGGLSDDVHTVASLRGYTVKDGCFVEGRLNQFVPQQGRG